eukprot:gb/GEZN01005655.1/.p1 GENE.gb/GEZN01005655.1/~~gb/GEZN01005655.1/.p1  ORF type:complete len:285 (+),score=27.26 gb/GEZN01005655.1/:688-1542(+)
MDRLDMSLDDMIKQENKSGGGRRGGSGRGRRGGRGGGRNGRDGGNGARDGGSRTRDAGSGSGGGRGRGASRDRPRNRSTPYERPESGSGGGRSRPRAPVVGLTELKVSAQSNPKTVAGALSVASRQGTVPNLLATGMNSLNQAVKAIAIARTYLEEDGFDLFCHPEMRDENLSAVTFAFKKCRLPGARQGNDMRVAGDSDVVKVAGAIANQVREDQRVSMLGIGPRSVCQAVLSICLAKKMLQEDNIRISFKPEFVKITNTRDDKGESSVVSGLRFHVHPEKQT